MKETGLGPHTLVWIICKNSCETLEDKKNDKYLLLATWHEWYKEILLLEPWNKRCDWANMDFKVVVEGWPSRRCQSEAKIRLLTKATGQTLLEDWQETLKG